MTKIIGTWDFDDGSIARLQETTVKGKPKIRLQVKKRNTWKTYQTLSKDKLPTVMNNIIKQGGVKRKTFKY